MYIVKKYKYKDYESYKEAQNRAYIRKKANVFVDKNEVDILICDYIFKFFLNGYPKDKEINVLCHGVRNGREVTLFSEALFDRGYEQTKVIGTEIGDKSSKKLELEGEIIEWDFHKVKEEWIGNIDIIYSNSFDHTIDPYKTLQTWKEQLKDDGMSCID